MTPIKLPTPPAQTSNNIQSPLDAHIKWIVDSGSIVQVGERIARLTYYPHGSIEHAAPPSKADAALAPSGNNIRARMKKRWAVNGAPVASSNESSLEPKKTNHMSVEGNGDTIDIRSPASGFLRVVWNQSTISNAIHVRNQQYAVSDIILAAVEPCEHPALVGTLCAVCGTDTRTASEVVDLTESPNGFQESKQEQQQVRTILRREHGDLKREIISHGNEHCSDVSANQAAADRNQTNAATKPTDNTATKSTNMAPTTVNINPISTNTTNVRSLSSLLSGAKTTQEMQQPQRQHHRPPPRRNLAQSTTNHASSGSTSDSNMRQMTVSGGVTLTISEAEAKSISEADSKKLRDSEQLCLVLDLDHTLLHATDDYRAGRFVADEVFVKETDENGTESNNNGTKAVKTKPNPQKRKDVRSILLPFEGPPEHYRQYIQRQQYQQQQQQQSDPNQPAFSPIPDQKLRHFVKLRPHLKEFFESIQSTYKLSVYTAGTRAYAERIAVMICRHLVGAPMDEEGLNALRAKVRAKDDELKRYKNWLERQKQLKLAKERDAKLDSPVSKKKNVKAKKVISFSDSTDDADGGGKPNSKKIEASQANSEDLLAKKVRGSLNVSSVKNSNDEPDASSKRPATSTTHIPRKKRKVESESLISLIAPPREETAAKEEDTLDDKQDKPKDPTEERDMLRKQLEVAESLYTKATQLRRKLFGSRIVSRTDVGDLGTDVKSLKRVFPCGGVMAAILDDREDVWANAKNNDTGRPGEPPDNLLLVRPYHWKPFSGYRDVNNASGADLSKNDDDKDNKESDEHERDEQLLWTADILKRLHQRFYSSTLTEKERDELSVPTLLRTMRQEVLSQHPQAKIVFSGIIPIQQQNVQTEVRLPMVRYAEELGAKIHADVTKSVTHVVAKRDGSEKIKRARETPGCYIVYPSWLMECYWSITRREEEPHHMGRLPTKPREAGLLLDHSADEEELEDEESDDFLANEMLVA